MPLFPVALNSSHICTEELAYYNEKTAKKPERSSKGKGRQKAPTTDTLDEDDDPNRVGTHTYIRLRKFIQFAKNPRWCGNWLDSSTVYSAGIPLFIQ